jgi:beta-xylosidase
VIEIEASLHANDYPAEPPRDPVHDSYFCAACILHRLRQLPAGEKAMSYWTFSDQFVVSTCPARPYL